MVCVNCGGGGQNHSAAVESVGGQQSDGKAGASSPNRAGGASSTGGTRAKGGANGTGGTIVKGGTSATGGEVSKGGTSATGGVSSKGGSTTGKGGASGTGGSANASGGVSSIGGSSAANLNSIPAVVDQGPQNVGYVNGLFVSVTLCVPGTTTCQTIDHVIVDTGSSGLRVLESVLTLSLPAIKNSAGAALGECTQFVSGTAWGPIVQADVKLGGETAAAIPIQAVGEKTYPMPTTGACVSGQPLTDLQSLRSNGILGLSIFQQDCGAACVQTRTNPGVYLACTSSKAGACAMTTVPLDSQVRNPIVGFAVDNNGVIIQLPSVPATGLVSTAGTLVFGIGTQSNNGLGAATVMTPVDAYGNIGTAFPVGGTKYAGFIDSGTNMFAFLNSATSGFPTCTARQFNSLYCPSATKNLSATIFGGNSANAPVNFSVANASKFNPADFAFSNIAEPMPGFPSTTSNLPSFLWGLPFFYGRSVYTAIELQDTPNGQGPYVAF
jgi:hypothetical protein